MNASLKYWIIILNQRKVYSQHTNIAQLLKCSQYIHIEEEFCLMEVMMFCLIFIMHTECICSKVRQFIPCPLRARDNQVSGSVVYFLLTPKGLERGYIFGTTTGTGLPILNFKILPIFTCSLCFTTLHKLIR